MAHPHSEIPKVPPPPPPGNIPDGTKHNHREVEKKFLFCSPEIPLLLPLVSDGTETPNESLVDDHKIHLEDQASKRSDQI